MVIWKFKNFKRDEFIYRCGCDILYQYEPNYFFQVLYFWQPLRDDIKKAIHVTSAIRCMEYNKTVGGSIYSYHTDNGSNFPYRPTAVDFTVYDLPQGFMADRISKNTNLNYCGYKMYVDIKDYCRGHIDFRGYKARW